MPEREPKTWPVRIPALIENIITPDLNATDVPELYWRDRILLGFLLTGVTIGLFLIGPVMVLQIREGLWVVSIISVLSLLCCIFMLIYKRIAYQYRAIVALLICYVDGLTIMIQVGIFSGGPAWLFAYPVLSGLFLGFRAALTALAVNTITLFALGQLHAAGICCQDQFFFESPAKAFIAGFSFILMNAVTAVSATILVRGLQSIAREAQTASKQLKKEHDRLLAAQADLGLEIEAHRKTEAFLQKSEEKYRLLAESITDVIWTVDLDMNFTYMSPAAEKLQGWRSEEFLEMKVQDILTPGSFRTAARLLAEELAIGEKLQNFNRTVTIELEVLHKDGHIVWTEVTASFLLDTGGQPIGLLGVTRDITERRKSEKEKADLQQKLERLKKMEALGLLAGGVAHDLNNVLSGIVSYPELLLMDLPRNSPLVKPIETMKASGEKAAAIVQDLLTLARRGVTHTEVLNLNSIVLEYLASPEHEKLISYHPGIQVDPRLEENLPNVLGSPVHLKKTVMNLVSNAAEAQPGGGKIIISTESCYVEGHLKGYEKIKEGEYVALKIEDYGEGIKPDDLQRIFEPFYTKKVMGRSGTGLGMAVVWGTVQDHRGYIDVKSTPGRGTLFTLFFPLIREPVPKRSAPTPIQAFCGSQESILVVDDMREQRDIAATILEKLNYRVSAVASGEEAIEFVRHHPVDLLMLDMIMDPGIDGLETFKRIKAFRPEQIAILASGFSETDRVKEAQRLGACAYVKKPYSMEKIARAVSEALGKAQPEERDN
jgi:PAS domain S-box-containing protein